MLKVSCCGGLMQGNVHPKKPWEGLSAPDCLKKKVNRSTDIEATMKASVIYHAIWKAKSDPGTPTKYMHAIGPHRGWTPHAHSDSKEPNYKLARAQSTTWEKLSQYASCSVGALQQKRKKLKNVRHALKTCVKFQRHLNLSLNWVAKRLATHYFREQRPQFGWHNLCAAYEKFIASFAMLISMSHWPVLRVNMDELLTWIVQYKS